MTADPRIDRYLEKERPWRDEMVALRSIILGEDVDEALKWRKPCYAAHGGNIAILAAMKDAVAVSFLKGVLLDDPEGRLEAPGPNSRSARYMKFASLDQIEKDAEILRGFLRAAIANEATGREVDLPDDDFELPAELEAALDADEEFADAWEDLTPGRRRGWVLHIGGAKQSETRERRVTKARPDVLKGRGWNER